MNQEEDKNELKSLLISSEIKTNLNTLTKWSNILSVIGFVSLIVIVLLGAFVTLMNGGLIGVKGSVPVAIIGFGYLIIGCCYFIPIKKLFDFGSKTDKALQLNDQGLLNESFKNLKEHYIYMVIFLILTFFIYLFSIIVFVLYYE
jgi:hypothetical protein